MENNIIYKYPNVYVTNITIKNKLNIKDILSDKNTKKNNVQNIVTLYPKVYNKDKFLNLEMMNK